MSNQTRPAEHLYPAASLVRRIASGLKQAKEGRSKLVVLVGAGASYDAVPGVQGIIELARTFVLENGGAGELRDFDEALDGKGTLTDKYAEAQKFLSGSFGRDAFDTVVQHAVLQAYSPAPTAAVNGLDGRERGFVASEIGEQFERDVNQWDIPGGLVALGKLLVTYPDCFGRQVLTTNFDPLLEIAIRRAGGRANTISLKADGDLSSSVGDGEAIDVVHLHGFWRNKGRDNKAMMHDPQQLQGRRPELCNSLADLIRDSTVVVVGYSGWDDIFTAACRNLNTGRALDVLWGFFDEHPERRKIAKLKRSLGLSAGLTAYSGVAATPVFEAVCQRVDESKGQSTPLATLTTVEQRAEGSGKRSTAVARASSSPYWDGTRETYASFSAAPPLALFEEHKRVVVAASQGNEVVLRDPEGRVVSRLSTGHVAPTSVVAGQDKRFVVAVAGDEAVWLQLNPSPDWPATPPHLTIPSGSRVLAVRSAGSGIDLALTDDIQAQRVHFSSRGRRLGVETLIPHSLRCAVLLESGLVGLDEMGGLVTEGDISPFTELSESLSNGPWDWLDAVNGFGGETLALLRRTDAAAEVFVFSDGAVHSATLGQVPEHVYLVRALDRRTAVGLFADEAESRVRVWRTVDLEPAAAHNSATS